MKTIKKIPIELARCGMFVHELDISWFDTPFFKHTGKIETLQQIKALKEVGVKTLVIDLGKGLDVQSCRKSPEVKHEWKPRKTVVTTLKHEMDTAIKIQHHAQRTIQQLLGHIQRNEHIEIDMITPVVDQTMDSLMRNEQAILTLINMKQHGSELFKHAFNVMSLCLIVGQQLKYPEDDLILLGIAGLIHDVGWTRLPMHLMAKRRKYAEAELKLVKKHPQLSVEFFKAGKGFAPEVIRMLLEHHEYCDGSGYPNGLLGEQLDPMSKIISVVDHYDEMIHGMFDQPCFIPGVAARFLFTMAKKGLLDETYVNQVIHILGIYPIRSAVKLKGGEKGIVIELNRDKPLCPKIKIYYNKQGSALTHP